MELDVLTLKRYKRSYMFDIYRFFSYFPIIYCIGTLNAMEHVPSAFKDLPNGVRTYVNSLPKIKEVSDPSDIEKQSIVITDYLLKMGGYPDQDLPGRNELRIKVEESIKSEQPIIRCIPAFPVSSANENKIPFDDEHAFGMGDFVALLTQNHISSEIGKVHKKGSALHIYWEPWVYDLNAICSDMLGAPEYQQSRIDSYQSTLAGLVDYFKPKIELGIPNRKEMEVLYKTKYSNIPVAIDSIKKNNYKFFFEGDLDSSTWENRAEKKLFESAKAKPLVGKLPNKLKTMPFDDIRKELQYEKKVKSQLGIQRYLKDTASQLAEAAIMGSQREALLMKSEIPYFDRKIRATVRPDRATVQDKVGTPMIYNKDGMPWHNVLIVQDAGIEIDTFKSISQSKKTYHRKYYEVGKYALPYYYRETDRDVKTS